MKTLDQSYLILRNVDFVAKYFPFFLQTSIRGTFRSQICYPSNLNLVFNSVEESPSLASPGISDPLFKEEDSPRFTKPVSASIESIASDPKFIFIDSSQI